MPSRVLPEPILLDDAAASSLLPPRPVRGHKGNLRKLLVLAGSVDYAGAALLVCTAAGRAGAGLVTLATPSLCSPSLPRKVRRGHDAVAAGGRCRRKWIPRRRWPAFSTTTTTPVVGPRVAAEPLDDRADPRPSRPGRGRRADAGGSRRGGAAFARDRRRVGRRRSGSLRPDATRGEFLRLRAADGVDTQEQGDLVFARRTPSCAAREAARDWGQVVVLKGARTVIADRTGERPCRLSRIRLSRAADGRCPGGNHRGPAGPGPWARSKPRSSACISHAMAGEAVRARLGDAGLLASDLTVELPLARKKLAALPGAGSAARAGAASAPARR